MVGNVVVVLGCDGPGSDVLVDLVGGDLVVKNVSLVGDLNFGSALGDFGCILRGIADTTTFAFVGRSVVDVFVVGVFILNLVLCDSGAGCRTRPLSDIFDLEERVLTLSHCDVC